MQYIYTLSEAEYIINSLQQMHYTFHAGYKTAMATKPQWLQNHNGYKTTMVT